MIHSPKNIPKYLQEIEGITDLNLLLDEIIKRKNIILLTHEGIKYLDWVEELYLKTSGNPSKDNLLIFGREMFPAVNQEPSFRAYAQVLDIDRQSPQAFHYIGKILMNNQLYFQSHLLFENGLGLPSSAKPDPYRKNMSFHRKFHNCLADLIGRIHEETDGELRISKVSPKLEPISLLKSVIPMEQKPCMLMLLNYWFMLVIL